MSDKLMKLTDEASYVTLKKHSPKLLKTIEQWIAIGSTAPQIELALGKMYSETDVMKPVVAAAIGAAYHLENKREKQS